MDVNKQPQVFAEVSRHTDATSRSGQNSLTRVQSYRPCRIRICTLHGRKRSQILQAGPFDTSALVMASPERDFLQSRNFLERLRKTLAWHELPEVYAFLSENI